MPDHGIAGISCNFSFCSTTCQCTTAFRIARSLDEHIIAGSITTLYNILDISATLYGLYVRILGIQISTRSL